MNVAAGVVQGKIAAYFLLQAACNNLQPFRQAGRVFEELLRHWAQ